MLLKIMSENGGYTIHSGVRSCHFRKSPDGSFADVAFEGGEKTEFPLSSPAYVLNDQGNTVDIFNPNRK